MVEDEGIEWKIRVAMNEAGLGDGGRHHVNVTSFNRVALSPARCRTRRRSSGGAKASGTAQVRGVHNELVIGKPTSFSTRAADTVVTGRVKLALVNSRSLRAPHQPEYQGGHREQRRVPDGLVTRAEAEAITAVVRTVPGVRQIVRLFEYPGA